MAFQVITDDFLSGMSPGEKILTAAQLIEGAAYELAGEIDSNKVSSLILVSAQLEKTGKGVDVQRVGRRGATDTIGNVSFGSCQDTG